MTSNPKIRQVLLGYYRLSPAEQHEFVLELNRINQSAPSIKDREVKNLNG